MKDKREADQLDQYLMKVQQTDPDATGWPGGIALSEQARQLATLADMIVRSQSAAPDFVPLSASQLKTRLTRTAGKAEVAGSPFKESCGLRLAALGAAAAFPAFALSQPLGETVTFAAAAAWLVWWVTDFLPNRALAVSTSRHQLSQRVR